MYVVAKGDDWVSGILSCRRALTFIASSCQLSGVYLLYSGEHMTEGEMAEFMSTLLGNADLGGSAETGTYDASNAGEFLRAHLPENITADNFAAQVLGFLTDGETTANND